jgi:hypothetical protein
VTEEYDVVIIGGGPDVPSSNDGRSQGKVAGDQGHESIRGDNG